MAKILSVEPPEELIVKHMECGATIEFQRIEVMEYPCKDYGGGTDI